MRKINTTAVCGEVSVLLSVLPPVLLTLVHISDRKTASVTGKKFNSPSVCDENKSPRLSAIWTETSENFAPENSLHPRD